MLLMLFYHLYFTLRCFGDGVLCHWFFSFFFPAHMKFCYNRLELGFCFGIASYGPPRVLLYLAAGFFFS